MNNRQTSKNHGFSSSVPPDERRVEGPMIGTIVFFLLRRVLRRPRSLVFDVAGGVCDYRYLDHAQRHCGIVSREIRSRTIPASTSSLPPDTRATIQLTLLWLMLRNTLHKWMRDDHPPNGGYCISAPSASLQATRRVIADHTGSPTECDFG
jgi:hypothetical protein